MRLPVLVAAAWLLMASCAAADPALNPSDSPPRSGRPLTLRRAMFDISEGKIWLHHGSPAACDLLFKEEPWRAVRYGDETPRLGPVFNEELRRAGLNGEDTRNLFEPREAPGGLMVGAVIKDVQVRECGNWNRSLAELAFHTSATMTVEWQVFDPLHKEILARVSTTARADDGRKSRDGVDLIVVAAFRENARALVARPEFREIVLAPSEAPDKRATPADRSTLLVALAKEGKTPIPQAVGSVVTIYQGDGLGTGFLISADGYLLTARHVVQDAKIVRIRWSDGFETEGEVLRSDKRRDVALIKSSPHSRQPLALHAQRLNPGDTVFAIGATLGDQYQGTVSRGIVSAYRLEEGLNYLQSDVMINHGNSGGPLLNDQGAVVAISDRGLFPNGDNTPVGMNFFVPIGDALDFLAIKAAP